jgi:predicted TPR repeat methyltransferase
MTEAELLALGLELHKTARLGEAERAYRAVLENNPEHVDALHFLGLLLHQAGFEKEGLELVQKAVGICPGYADAQSNLGNLLRAQGRQEEAANAYRRAIEANPRHAHALNNLGVILKDMGELDQAMATFRRALELAPASGDAHFNLGNLLLLKGREEEAIIEYRQAIAVQPKLVEVFDALSRTLRKMGREREASQVLEKLNNDVPGNPVIQFLLAAFTGRDVPAKANEVYVRTIFDRFADTFDHVLHALDYRAPSLVTGIIATRWPIADRGLEVLDAGCGTGLCGTLLKPYARRLIGVDLSVGMLEKARLRNVYDELVQSELTRFMQEHPAAYDLIASSDTLVYFGELTAVLAAAANALRPAGMLVFTLEDAGQTLATGFQLQPHGRYVHSEDYVARMLAAAGLTNFSITKDVLRKESGKPVAGLIVAAGKAS